MTIALRLVAIGGRVNTPRAIGWRLRIAAALPLIFTLGLLPIVVPSAHAAQPGSATVTISMQPGQAWAVTVSPQQVMVEETVQQCVTFSVRTSHTHYTVAVAYAASEPVTVLLSAGRGECDPSAPQVRLGPSDQRTLWQGLNGSIQLHALLTVQHVRSGNAALVELKATIADVPQS